MNQADHSDPEQLVGILRQEIDRLWPQLSGIPAFADEYARDVEAYVEEQPELTQTDLEHVVFVLRSLLSVHAPDTYRALNLPASMVLQRPLPPKPKPPGAVLTADVVNELRRLPKTGTKR